MDNSSLLQITPYIFLITPFFEKIQILAKTLINFNEGNFKRQIVKGRVSFRILTLTLGITLHGHLLNWGVTPSDSVDKIDRLVTFSATGLRQQLEVDVDTERVHHGDMITPTD